MASDSIKQLSVNTFKTADEIHKRLFDHKQFTTGELSFFVRELEEKRRIRELDAVNICKDAVSHMQMEVTGSTEVLAGDAPANLSAKRKFPNSGFRLTQR